MSSIGDSDVFRTDRSSADDENDGFDSGIEENVENDISVLKEHFGSVKIKDSCASKLKNGNESGLTRKGSFWNIFNRKSRKSTNKNINKTTLVRPQSYHSGYSDVPGIIDQSRRTSDLGESIPSTPASTVSSGFSGFYEIPGITGLHNLGNTCYINAIVQCLSHIDQISEYFATEHFMTDLAKCNRQLNKGKSPVISTAPAASSQTTSNNNEMGQLTYMVGLLVKSIWNSEIYTQELMREVMDVVKFYDSSYNLHEQQDALEFFMWLVDKIHMESFTGTSKKKSLKVKDSKKRKQQQKQAEQAVLSFASYTKYKSSFIQGLFLSQYQSTIKCSNCSRLSFTFDPYISLSLDIPSQPKCVLYTTVVCANQNISPPTRYAFELQRKGTMHELRNEIVDQAGITKFVIMEEKEWGVTRILKNDNPLSILPKEMDRLYAVEMREDLDTMEGHKIALVVSNVERNRKQNKRFGLPVVVQVSDLLSIQKLQSLIRKAMQSDVKDNLVKIIRENPVRLGLKVIHENNFTVFLGNNVDYPLLQPNISRFIEYDDNLQMDCLYLLAEWETNLDTWYMSGFHSPTILMDPSCHRVADRLNEPFTVDLHECLRLQTKEETITEVGSWRCPFCSHPQEGITKQMTLWSLPDVLALHLKRFDQIQRFNNKSSTVVSFPVRGLDLSPYVATVTENNVIKRKYYEESLKMQYQPPPQTQEECVYDLRAICNHHGSDLDHGHYTATCYNSVNDTWYNFDDRKVTPVHELNIENSQAYILFYQRREIQNASFEQ